MEEAFYGPTFGFFVTILFLNVFQCVFGIRRVRVLERRVWLLENKVADQQPQQTTNPSVPSAPTQTSYTYVQPPVYQYYQQPMTTPPTAAAYYPQDPQRVY
jgi:hypothetical protein